jgi:hypothetical protein
VKREEELATQEPVSRSMLRSTATTKLQGNEYTENVHAVVLIIQFIGF